MFKKIAFIFSLLILLGSCSSGEQFTTKVVAPVFVAQLYGTVSKTITLSHPSGGHIKWMGFIESNNYKYFKVTQIQMGSAVVVSEGALKEDGTTFTPSSNVLFQDITVTPTTGDIAGYVNGNVTTGGSADLKITIEYSPLISINSETEPHQAFLIINYDAPEVGSMRIELDGYTQGIKNEKCARDPSNMEMFNYKLDGSAFDLYFCGKEVAVKGQNNTNGEYGASTNFASVPMSGTDVITFYKVDDETVCLLSNPIISTSSIETFDLPIPDNLAPIDSMEVGMVKGSFAECSLDTSGNILCPETIQISALVSTSGFSMSNIGYTAEELVTTDCPDFGAISGEKTFGESSLSLIFMGRTLADSNSEAYNIVDSLIVGVFKMKLQE